MNDLTRHVDTFENPKSAENGNPPTALLQFIVAQDAEGVGPGAAAQLTRRDNRPLAFIEADRTSRPRRSFRKAETRQRRHPPTPTPTPHPNNQLRGGRGRLSVARRTTLPACARMRAASADAMNDDCRGLVFHFTLCAKALTENFRP